MGKKSNTAETESVPATLSEHIFYGMMLDDEQKAFRDAIWSEDKLVIFCNAKAGTGKTTIATATANLLVKYRRYKKIAYIAAPTQEEKQGYLKGTLEEKSEPYFEPFYQALDKIGISKLTAIIAENVNGRPNCGFAECMTHTFLRGTNFEETVVIIDECQNYTVSELQKVLTRVHDSCKVILIGHTGQKDIEQQSGFEKYIKHFERTSKTAVCRLTKNYRGWISTHADLILC